MKTALVLLANDELFREGFGYRFAPPEQQKENALKNILNYDIGPAVPVFAGEGEEVAEEMFDLSNNPGRQEERDAVWGRNRSLSVGDIVMVDNTAWLCASMGWIQIK